MKQFHHDQWFKTKLVSCCEFWYIHLLCSKKESEKESGLLIWHILKKNIGLLDLGRREYKKLGGKKT